MLHLGVEPSITEATLDAMAAACEARLMALDRAALGLGGHA
jgi:hypothetical protein